MAVRLKTMILVAGLLSSWIGRPSASASVSLSVMPAGDEIVACWSGGEVSGASLEGYILSKPPRQRRPASLESLKTWQVQMAVELLVQELLIAEASAAGLLESPSFENGWRKAQTKTLAEAMLAQATAEMEIVGPEQIEAWYQKHLERYRREEAILTRHIFLRAELSNREKRKQVRERIEEIRKEILAGADFASMAKRFSDSENAPGGGLLPWHKRGTLHLLYESAAWALGPGEISPVVETEWGFHIIRLERRQEAGVLPLSEVEARIEQTLKEQAVREAEGSLVNSLAVRMGLESATPVHRARGARSYQLLARAAREEGMDTLPEVQSQLRTVWREAAERAGRVVYFEKWKSGITDEALRQFYSDRRARYQSSPKYDLFIIELHFREDRSQMETKLEAEECSRLMQAGRIEEASGCPGAHSFRLVGVTPRELARRSSRDLAKAVRSLEVGEVSGPIRYEEYSGKTMRYDPLGYWVVRLEGRDQPEQPSFDEVRDAVARDYLSRHADDFKEFVKKELFKKYAVKILISD